MTEGEQGMSGPEQRPAAEQPAGEIKTTPPLKPLREEISFLLLPEADKQGGVVIEPIIRESNLTLRTRIAPFLHEGHDNVEDLMNGIREINIWFNRQSDLEEDGKITKEEYRRRVIEGVVAKQVLEERKGLLLKTKEKPLSDYVQTLPGEMGAAFSNGMYRESVMRRTLRGDEVRPILDVTNPRDRERWLLLNVRTFLGKDTLVDPQDVWEKYTNFWTEDFKEAMIFIRQTVPQSEKLVSRDEEEEFFRKIKAFMAIASSAAAMRFSGGDFNKYAEGIGHLRRGELNLDVKDYWAESLLHGDPDKLTTVLLNPLIGTFYREIIKRAGVIIPDIVHSTNSRGERVPLTETQGTRKRLTEWEQRIKRSTLFNQQGEIRTDNGNLLQYLNRGGGGFDLFIKEVLLSTVNPESENYVSGFEDYSQLELTAAARMACNAFLVDKYTQWEYLINKGRDEALQIKPTGTDWGGNPFMSCLVPSFLLQEVKGMYQGVGDLVAKEFDRAFFPREAFYTNMTPEALDRTTRLILETLPQLNREELQNLTSQQKGQIIKEGIRRIIPQLDEVAIKDGVCFGDRARKNNQHRLTYSLDPWQAISHRALSLAENTLSLSSDQRISILRKIGEEPLSGVIVDETDQEAFETILRFRGFVKGALDEATRATELSPTRPTATEDFKKLFRYNDAIFSVMGSSRGESLPYWSDETIGALKKAIERIDDIYKGDKMVVGLIIAKIIKTKVLASVLEGFRPGFQEKLSHIFSNPSKTVSTFLEADRALFGERGDGRSGLMADLMGVRRDIIVEGNEFFALEHLGQAQRLLRKAGGFDSFTRGIGVNMQILKALGSL